MHQREIREIIETWKACGENYSETARRLGVDRRTVSHWVERGRQPWGYVRWQGVKRHSTAPKHPKRALSAQEEGRVLAFRQETGYCREKLAAWAKGEGISASASTLHRLLARQGVVRPTHPARRDVPTFRTVT